jgi:hypothetical protein
MYDLGPSTLATSVTKKKTRKIEGRGEEKGETQ